MLTRSKAKLKGERERVRDSGERDRAIRDAAYRQAEEESARREDERRRAKEEAERQEIIREDERMREVREWLEQEERREREEERERFREEERQRFRELERERVREEERERVREEERQRVREEERETLRDEERQRVRNEERQRVRDEERDRDADERRNAREDELVRDDGLARERAAAEQRHRQEMISSSRETAGSYFRRRQAVVATVRPVIRQIREENETRGKNRIRSLASKIIELPGELSGEEETDMLSISPLSSISPVHLSPFAPLSPVHLRSLSVEARAKERDPDAEVNSRSGSEMTTSSEISSYVTDYELGGDQLEKEDEQEESGAESEVWELPFMDVVSTRGEKKKEHDGHLFIKDKCSSDGKLQFWRCDKKTSEHCKARIHTDGENVVKELHEHSHDSSAARCVAQAYVTEVKKRATMTAENPCRIKNKCSQNLGPATLQALPDSQAIRKVIQRARHAVNMRPPNPTSLTALVIPEMYKTYSPAPGVTENFLLLDSAEVPDADPENRILVFGREANMAWASQMKHLFMDGTFRSAPHLFHQVFAILAERNNYVFPVLTALLPDKSASTYRNLFSLIKTKWPDFSPSSISIDFEKAAFSAAQTVFPSVEIRGCLFHLAKNFKKQIGDNKLSKKYNTDAEFAVRARMILGLAFVPPRDLEQAIRKLESSWTPDEKEELQAILHWFEDSYMGRRDRRGERLPARFPVEMWNVNQRVLEGQPRTNNIAEAAHRRLQIELGVDHPTLWGLIDSFREIQKTRDKAYEDMVAGKPAPVKRNCYVQTDQRLLNLVQRYDSSNILEFLRGVSYNVQMN